VMAMVHWKLHIRIPIREGAKNFSVLITPVVMIAAPSILEPMSFQAYMIVLNWVAAEVSDLALTVKIYAYNTFLFCLMISIAMSMATEAIIAQRVGLNRHQLTGICVVCIPQAGVGGIQQQPRNYCHRFMGIFLEFPCRAISHCQYSGGRRPALHGRRCIHIIIEHWHHLALFCAPGLYIGTAVRFGALRYFDCRCRR
jgi:hypothetical protein